jgi:hypothetical protein
MENMENGVELSKVLYHRLTKLQCKSYDDIKKEQLFSEEEVASVLRQLC